MPKSVKGFRYAQKTPLTSSDGLTSNECKFRVLLRNADAHMNHWAGSLIDCS